MSAVATSSRVRVWRVVPEPAHPDAAVDVSGIEPTTGLTQRAARELADDWNREGILRPTIRWVPEPAGRVADQSAIVDQLRTKGDRS